MSMLTKPNSRVLGKHFETFSFDCWIRISNWVIISLSSSSPVERSLLSTINEIKLDPAWINNKKSLNTAGTGKLPVVSCGFINNEALLSLYLQQGILMRASLNLDAEITRVTPLNNFFLPFLFMQNHHIFCLN